MSKLISLKRLLKNYKRVAVAFSGGVDSTLLLYLATKVLNKDNVFAAVFISPIYAQSEINWAKRIIKELGCQSIFIFTAELEDKNFIRNSPKRCYFCKKEAYRRLKEIAQSLKIKQIIEGTNDSDLKDFRPGRKAVKELGILSPYLECRISKKEIRKWSKRFHLPNFNKPATPCLASRIPFYEAITIDKLNRAEKGEKILAGLNLKDFRLRFHKDLARLEIKSGWREVLEKRELLVKNLKKLGFSYVTLDLEGYIPQGIRYKS